MISNFSLIKYSILTRFFRFNQAFEFPFIFSYHSIFAPSLDYSQASFCMLSLADILRWKLHYFRLSTTTPANQHRKYFWVFFFFLLLFCSSELEFPYWRFSLHNKSSQLRWRSHFLHITQSDVVSREDVSIENKIFYTPTNYEWNFTITIQTKKYF